MVRWSGERQVNVRWASGESQSELDFGGRETCWSYGFGLLALTNLQKKALKFKLPWKDCLRDQWEFLDMGDYLWDIHRDINQSDIKASAGSNHHEPSIFFKRTAICFELATQPQPHKKDSKLYTREYSKIRTFDLSSKDVKYTKLHKGVLSHNL